MYIVCDERCNYDVRTMLCAPLTGSEYAIEPRGKEYWRFREWLHDEWHLVMLQAHIVRLRINEVHPHLQSRRIKACNVRERATSFPP